MTIDEIKIGGLGASRRRVEDNRFIRGKGNYIDDISLPGMLHMEIPPQPARPRPHQVHRYERGVGDPGSSSRAHR